jgi:hypothetical protein
MNREGHFHQKKKKNVCFFLIENQMKDDPSRRRSRRLNLKALLLKASEQFYILSSLLNSLEESFKSGTLDVEIFHHVCSTILKCRSN